MANVTIMGADYQNVNEIYLKDTDTGDELKFVLKVTPTRVLIIPEQTITVSSDATPLQFNAPLILGEKYFYAINGVERTQLAWNDNVVALGSSPNEGEIGYINGNTYFFVDSDAQYGTYTIKVEQDVSGDISTTLVIPEQTINATETYNSIANFAEQFVVGEQYIYTVDGESHTTVARDLYGSVAIWADNTPWLFEYDRGMYFTVNDSSAYGSHVIKVEKVLSS